METMHVLVAEGMRKAAIAWITAGTAGPYPVWCLWIEAPGPDGAGQQAALFLVGGGDEQPVPGLDGAATATVSARGDHGGRIVSWTAAVTTVEPGSDAWTEVAPALAAKRLNASGTSEAVVTRWAATSRIYRLTPATEDVLEMPDGSLATAPIRTPASRRTANPFRLHKVRRPRAL